jgi:hypothetical protein
MDDAMTPDRSRRTGGFANMARKAIGILVTLVLFALVASPAMAAEAVGEVTRFHGVGTAAGGAPERSLALGVEIHTGDTIRTRAATRVEIIFDDGTKLTFGDDSSLTVDEFIYDGLDAPSEAFFSLTASVFRAVSGHIAQLTGAPFRVRTPFATIGIRGPEFWGQQAADSLLVALLGGKGVYLENEAGRVEITEVGFAVTATAATEAPSTPFRLCAAELAAALDTVAW